MQTDKLKSLVVENVVAPMDIQEWRRRFDEVSKTKPEQGQILYAQNGEKVKLTIEFYPNRPPLIFTRVFVPQNVGQEPRWVVQAESERMNFGWKGLLRPKSRDEVIKKAGVSKDFVLVKSVKVVKISESGDSVQLEINEW